MTTALVDTDILIDAARHDVDAIASLESLDRSGGIAVSVITQLELLIGCRNKTEQRKTERFLEGFSLLRLDEATCDIAVELVRQYRLSHGLLIADALIAATALAQGLPFITKNQRDFRFIEGLTLLAYPQPL